MLLLTISIVNPIQMIVCFYFYLMTWKLSEIIIRRSFMSRFFMTIIALCKRNKNNNSYNEYNKRATRTNHPIFRIR